MTQQREVRTVPQWQFPGWHAVLGGGTLSALVAGYWAYPQPIWVAAVRPKYGFTALEMGVNTTVTRSTIVFGQAICGWAFDKWGPRVTSLIGIFLCSSGFALLSQLDAFQSAFGRTGALWAMFFAWGVLEGNASNFATYGTVMPTVARWFVRRRANAMGTVSTIVGVGATIGIPTVAWMVDQWGFNSMLWIVVAANFLLGIPLILLYKPRLPEHYGFLPDNVTTEVAQAEARLARTIESPVKLKDYTIGEAARTLPFWMYIVALTCAQYALSGIALFQTQRMQEVGYTTQAAANFLGFQFLMTLAGRGGMMLFGELDIAVFDARHVVWEAWALSVVGLLLFAVGTQDWYFYGWAILYGVGQGALQPVLGIWRASFFGRAHMGKIYNYINSIQAAATIPSGIVIGWLVDLSGFRTTFLVTVAITAVGTVIFMFTRRPREQPSPTAIRRAAKEAEAATRRQQQGGS